MILVTGGAGFIGANFVLSTLKDSGEPIVNLDKLTYAGNLGNLQSLRNDSRHVFVKGDICDRELVRRLLNQYKPRAIVHLAAESHVDRSIAGPAAFVETNVVGTFSLLEEARAFSKGIRFLHVSTDEVYGSLSPDDPAFSETTPYAPNSPYSASKAAADHLVRAYHHTYGMATLTTNCSNNFGPYQFPEKLIPLTIRNALAGKPLPVYGDGQNIRDWLYVTDHCEALRIAAATGAPGETYNVGGRNERTTIQIAHAVCDALDELAPRKGGKGSHRELITFVKDRPGHDRRYAIDPSKAIRELAWQPTTRLEEGIKKTVRWYLEHREWCDRITQGVYKRERLGLPGVA